MYSTFQRGTGGRQFGTMPQLPGSLRRSLFTAKALCRAVLLLCVLVPCSLSASSKPAEAGSANSAGPAESVLFFDDFDQLALDTVHWVPGENQWGTENTNNGVTPKNLSLTTVTDPATGKIITVLDAQTHGDTYTGSVPGIYKKGFGFEPGNPLEYGTPGQYKGGYVRTGGVAWTRLRYGPARYQIRMKALQLSGGETAIWNYYDPTALAPGSGDYTEIDVEMPANETNGNYGIAGLNSYATTPGTDPATGAITCNCAPTAIANQADGKFHLYEFDWYDGSDGSQPRIVWYVDGVLAQTSTKNIPTDPAQLWVGNWPAYWSYMGKWDFASQDQYIDYVKITKLAGNSYPAAPLPAPQNLTLAAGSNTTVDLAWQELADSRTVAGYNVLANGVLVKQTPETHIELTGLAANTAYVFTVEAINTAMLPSEPSNAVNYKTASKTPGCKANPTSPITSLAATASTKNNQPVVTLKWTPPQIGTKDGDLGGSSCSIAGYVIASSSKGAVVVTKPSGTYVDSAVSAGEFRYDVTPYNQYGTGPTSSVFVTVPKN